MEIAEMFIQAGTLQKKQPLPQIVFDAVKKIQADVDKPFRWFVTGSFAYRGYTIDAKSDIDIVVSCAYETDEPTLDEKGDVVYPPAYFDLDGQKINIISKPDRFDFNLWRKATESMIIMWPLCDAVRNDRDVRVKFFKAIVTSTNYVHTTEMESRP